jgi:hypothetical protein
MPFVVVLQHSISLHSRAFQHVNLSLHLQQLVLFQYLNILWCLALKDALAKSQPCSLQVIATFLLMGLVFIPVGLVTLRASYSVYIIYSYVNSVQCSFFFFPSISTCLLQYVFDVGCWNCGQIWYWLCTWRI